jgi:fused signal recognition particle receptor
MSYRFVFELLEEPYYFIFLLVNYLWITFRSFDAILTKIDADAKGGSAISIVYTTSKPIVYLGVGQGYDDIIRFDTERFVQSLF